MNYVKKMCVLRQLKQGFSGDGKTLSGLIKVEQYGTNVSVEVSVVNFAPLSSGEYFCLIADEKERCELLPLRGKSFFNIVSDLDLSGGFCGVICFVKTDVVPLAYGINGTKTYDWKRLLSKLFPETKKAEKFAERSVEYAAEKEQPQVVNQDPFQEEEKFLYNDDTVATENYFEREEQDEQIEFEKARRDAYAQSGAERETEKERENATTHAHDQNVQPQIAKEPDGYYLSVKNELDALFAAHPKDDRLKTTFPFSEWVRVEEQGKSYLVGVIYENLKAKYICYALPAEDQNSPPEEIKGVCSFVPTAPFEGAEGFFVLFQSTATGECLQVKEG